MRVLWHYYFINTQNTHENFWHFSIERRAKQVEWKSEEANKKKYTRHNAKLSSTSRQADNVCVCAEKKSTIQTDVNCFDGFFFSSVRRFSVDFDSDYPKLTNDKRKMNRRTNFSFVSHLFFRSPLTDGSKYVKLCSTIYAFLSYFTSVEMKCASCACQRHGRFSSSSTPSKTTKLCSGASHFVVKSWQFLVSTRSTIIAIEQTTTEKQQSKTGKENLLMWWLRRDKKETQKIHSKDTAIEDVNKRKNSKEWKCRKRRKQKNRPKIVEARCHCKSIVRWMSHEKSFLFFIFISLYVFHFHEGFEYTSMIRWHQLKNSM